MRELLVTITLLSVQVSSDEFEARKRLELPPEVDPNFWPVRGRRSYWENVETSTSGQLFGNYFIKNENPRMASAVHFARRNHLQSPLDTNFYDNGFATPTRRGFTWIPAYTTDVSPVGSDEQDYEGISPGIWGSRFCSRKKPISVVIPYGEDSNMISAASGICPGLRCGGDPVGRNRGRREDERWRTQKPLYVDEPRWIEIDYNQGNWEGSKQNEDPFFVARGKRRLDDGNFSDIRERRHLDDLIDSYNSEPFFITRGKRSLKNDDLDGLQVPKIWNERSGRDLWDNSGEDNEESRKVLESEKVKTTDSLKSILKNSSEDLKFSGTTTSTTTKSLGNLQLDLDNKRIARSPVGPKNVNSESETSSAEGGNVKNWETYNLQKNDEFIPAKPDRYSRPRDKHSNLQSILEEPFFISRGKKDDDEKYSEIYKVPSSDRDRTISPRTLSNFLRIYENRRRFRTTDGLEFPRGTEYGADASNRNDDEEPLNYGIIRIRKSKLDGTDDEPPRSRRGMLEELLDQKTDDPFYVARGKKFVYNTKPSIPSSYDNSQTSKPNKYSLFSKTTQTKLLQKLSNFPKKPFAHVVPEDLHEAESNIQGDKNFWNMFNNNAIN